MSGSMIVATKKAILQELAGRPGLTGVQMAYADDTETAQRERLFFGDVDENDHEPLALRAGRRLREENFTLHLFVEVVGRGAYDVNEQRALDICQEVEEYLADTPKLGDRVPGLVTALSEGLNLRTSASTDGPVSRVDLRIRVKGRLL